MREIVLDTETTGLDPSDGHRIIEIGAVELLNHMPTGRNLQLYINPERDVPAEAVAVHGLTQDFLKDKPTFGEVVGDFIDFVAGDPIIAHNAEFDVKFLNAELKKFGFPPIRQKRVIDTLALVRKKFPGSPASLDALCKRFGIDNSSRTLHGALLDSQILAEVYLELIGGRQHGMALESNGSRNEQQTTVSPTNFREIRPVRPHHANKEELREHARLLQKIDQALWIELGLSA